MNDGGQPAEKHITGGGGIVFGDVDRSPSAAPASAGELMTAIRKRWVTGVSVLTAVDKDGGLRGVTANSFLMVSIDPPTIAIALSTGGSFHSLLEGHAIIGASLLDASHSFVADRFAGRAPVPDAVFSGVRHVVHRSGVPIFADAIGWFVGRVTQRIPVGDHILVLAEMEDGGLIQDSDDPLVNYDGRYRTLEVG